MISYDICLTMRLGPLRAWNFSGDPCCSAVVFCFSEPSFFGVFYRLSFLLRRRHGFFPNQSFFLPTRYFLNKPQVFFRPVLFCCDETTGFSSLLTAFFCSAKTVGFFPTHPFFLLQQIPWVFPDPSFLLPRSAAEKTRVFFRPVLFCYGKFPGFFLTRPFCSSTRPFFISHLEPSGVFHGPSCPFGGASSSLRSYLRLFKGRLIRLPR